MTNPTLIIVDLQNDYYEGGRFPLPGVNSATDHAIALLKAWRETGNQVVHVRHEAPASAPFFHVGSVGAEIRDALTPAQDEIVVVKAFPNAFHSTTLHDTLQNRGVERIVLLGAMAQMCIDATARAGLELGYDVTIAHEAIAAQNAEFNGISVSHDNVHVAFVSALHLAGVKISGTDTLVEQVHATEAAPSWDD